MRAHDWSQSALGLPQDWPPSLRTVVRIMLNTGHPMYIFWGAEGSCLYNDAYRESIGSERHPGTTSQQRSLPSSRLAGARSAARPQGSETESAHPPAATGTEPPSNTRHPARTHEIRLILVPAFRAEPGIGSRPWTC